MRFLLLAMTNTTLREKPYAGNPHVRFDEGAVVPAATPRRGSLLYQRTASLLAAAFASALCLAAVKPGENLLLNGRLECDQVDFPPFWKVYSLSSSHLKWHPSGGPGGLPYISVLGQKAPDVRLYQYGLNLAEGGKYRISMQVRTKGLATGSYSGVMVVNGGSWRSTAGIMSLPRDTTGRWTRVSCDFRCFSSVDGYWALIRSNGQRGDLDIADVRLEALDGIALQKSGPSMLIACEQRPRLVPMPDPLLSRIPAEDPNATFFFFGDLEKPDEAYEIVLAAEGASAPVRRPLLRQAMRIPLPSGATNGVLTARVAERATGKAILERRYNFRVVRGSFGGASSRRTRRNNLCAEVLSATLSPDVTNRHAFALARDGWAFAAIKARPCAGFSVKIDGREVIDAATPRLETFRQLTAGEHVLEVVGVKDGRAVVREIAEILNYCPGVNSLVKENPPYDWDFNERYVLPAVTTQLGGSIPKEHLGEFHRRGYKWMGNLNLTGGAADFMVKKLSSCPGMSDPSMDGVACDEQNCADVTASEAYANGFWAYDLEKHPDRPVYTWAYGKPESPAVAFEFLSACINVAGGTGKLVREHYCSTKETEEAARQELQVNVADVLKRYRDLCPAAMPSIGVAFGNFNQVPILSKAHHPEVDYKYYLDMQMNLAANDPACRDLGLVGYWGSYYADDELHRWSFALTRHYVVEGNTNMLSEAYGFRYRPDHVLNGDFRGTLAPWTAKGEVRTDSHPNFASRSQNRWGGSDNIGDTFAVLVRREGEPSSLSQTVKGLEPGRKYCLQFATFDVRDVKANRIAPRRFGIAATLSGGVEVDRALSWVHVDERIKGRYEMNNGIARINLHHIVFAARSREVELTIDNAAASPGEELGVNYLSLNPYFAR